MISILFFVICTYKQYSIYFVPEVDFGECSRLLPPGIALDLTLITNSARLVLISNTEEDKYDILIKDMVLHLATVKLDENLSWGVEQAMVNECVARYYYNQHYIKKFTLSKGDYTFSKENLFDSDKLPSRFYVMLMSTDAIESPKLNTNPLILKDFKLKKIECKLNSQNIGQCYDDLDIANSKCKDLYCAFINSLKSFQRPIRLIAFENYGKKRTIMSFRLSDEARDDVITESIDGRVSLELSFREALSNPINLYIYYKRFHLCSIFGKDKECLQVTDNIL